MNYYPNFMGSYPYTQGNGNSQYAMPQQNQYFQQNYQNQQPQMPMQQQFLNGKIVDSADVVRATEVPMGGYGVFPKADFSEIYIKTWNNNGTTNIIPFKPIPQENVNSGMQADSSAIKEILEKITVLEGKLDDVINAQKAPVTVRRDKKETV